MPRCPAAAQLLHGPYTSQPVAKGDRVDCLLRGDAIVTSWSDGRIPWPKCRRVGERGGHGLLLDDELARAVRSESSLALQHWFGVTATVVWRWRKTLGVGQWEPEGSRRLHQVVSQKGAERTRGQKLPADQVERRRQTALTLGLRPPGFIHGRPWTRKELAIVGTLPDAEVSRRLGRTRDGVRAKRGRLRRPASRAGR
jgi:hypothetical protein